MQKSVDNSVYEYRCGRRCMCQLRAGGIDTQTCNIANEDVLCQAAQTVRKRAQPAARPS